MLSKTYAAFKAAGAPDVIAREAAEEIATITVIIVNKRGAVKPCFREVARLSFGVTPAHMAKLEEAAERYNMAVSVLARDALARGLEPMLDARRRKSRQTSGHIPGAGADE